MPNALSPTRTSPSRFQRWFAQASVPADYWLSRFVLLRFLGIVYFFAFFSAARQIVPLIGHEGLLPVEIYLTRLTAHFGSGLDGFLELPSLFWLDSSDAMLLLVSWTGVILSLIVMGGYANGLIMLAMWVLYTSIGNVGQSWFSFGWDMQILETGFLAVFLCPLLDGHPFSRRPPSVIVMWLYRWLIFRIMLGAGLIKLRSDVCWRDLTCLYYHYETQPIPNPLSYWLHFRPHWFHQAGVLWNHFIELIVPWFAFWPRTSRHVAGVLLVSFQVILILSGNLSFLNWLTIVPALACFDDTFWARLLPRRLVELAKIAKENRRPTTTVQEFIPIVLALLVGLLSIEPVANLFSKNQKMNASFERLKLVNTYGAFGSVGHERFEIIFEGTDSPDPQNAEWREYQFPYKPGDINRRPPIVAPYQPRLDWQIWFAAMATPQDHPWTVNLVWKLLHNDPGALSLLAGNPFPTTPPRFIRATLYRYRYTRPGEADGSWWHREKIGPWLPPLSADQPELKDFLRAYSWQ